MPAKQKQPKRPPRVTIIWHDALTLAGWRSFDDDNRLPVVETRGFLMRATKEAYYVAQGLPDRADEWRDCWLGMTIIPRGFAVKVRRER